MAQSQGTITTSWELDPEWVAVLGILAAGSRKTIDIVAKMRQHHPSLIPNGVDSVVSHLGLLRRMGLMGTNGTGGHTLTSEGLLAWEQLRRIAPPTELPDEPGQDIFDLLASRLFQVSPEGLSPTSAAGFLATQGIATTEAVCQSVLERLVSSRGALHFGELYWNPAHFRSRPGRR